MRIAYRNATYQGFAGVRFPARWVYSLALGLTLLLSLGGSITAHAAPLTATCAYTVQSGDTLGAIARRYNSSVAAIAAASGVENPNLIRVGQTLIIPNCDGTAAAPPAMAPQTPARPTLTIRAESIDTTPTPKEIPQRLLDRAIGATINIEVDTYLGFTAGGTGTVIGADGRTFLTAFHVVGDTESGRLYPAKEIRVGPFKEWTLRAQVIATDPDHDLAVLRVREADDFYGFAFAPLGNSSVVKLGDTVYTLSYPGVAKGGLVTTRGSVLSMLSLHGDTDTRYFLTDAHASPGSSGGIAIDERGEVIGIVSAVIFRRNTLDRLGLPQVDRVTAIVPINWGKPLLEDK